MCLCIARLLKKRKAIGAIYVLSKARDGGGASPLNIT